MSDVNDRYLTPESVMANRFINYPKPEWKIAILCFRDYVGCEVIVNTFNAKPLEGYKVFYGIDSVETHRQVFEADIDGIKIGIITRLSWGGPQAAILVEELSYMGIDYVIGYGGAGSIDKDVHKGDIVLGTTSLVTDGTSRSYITEKPELHCNKELLQIVKDQAYMLDYHFKEVKVANVDALYRETKNFNKKLSIKRSPDR